MANGLETQIRQAYLPYVRAFLQDGATARLQFANTSTTILATLQLSQRDHNRFDADVALRAGQRRAFNSLARELDATRTPALRF